MMVAMKRIRRFFFFLFFVCLCMTVSFFFLEHFDGLSLRAAGENLHPVFREKDGHVTLSWTPLSYPSFYKVEVLSKTTGLVEGEPRYHFFLGRTVREASVEVPRTAIPTYYRITAYGLFGPVTEPSPAIAHPDFAEDAKGPSPISRYDADNPASRMPFLIWHTVPGAVCYEVEILSSKPDQEGGTSLSKKGRLESTRQVFTNGWQADLRPYKKLDTIYWRVRALDIHLNPIGEFSEAQEMHVDDTVPLPNAPLLNNFDTMPNFRQPLYPVYSWIPTHNAMRYEVQLLTSPPDAPTEDGKLPEPAWSRVVDSATTCYDEYARPYAGDYYWRVRAVDTSGLPASGWSEAAHFVVPEQTDVEYAALGDSITHGGGAVSFAPSSVEYSYTTYLDVPCLNLGRSGDTSRMTADRFGEDVVPFHPKKLFILTGTNCLRTPTINAQSVIEDLTTIRQKCEDNGIRPIFLTLMPVNPENILYAFHTPTDPSWRTKMQKINTWIRSQQDYIDLEPYFYAKDADEMDGSLSIDGLHPDIRGKQLMAEVINQVLKETK